MCSLGKKTRRRFSREFKLEAINLASRERISVSQVARDLGIGENLLRRWKKQYDRDGGQAFDGHGKTNPQAEELARLKRKLARVGAASVSEQENLDPVPGSGVYNANMITRILTLALLLLAAQQGFASIEVAAERGCASADMEMSESHGRTADCCNQACDEGCNVKCVATSPVALLRSANLLPLSGGHLVSRIFDSAIDRSTDPPRHPPRMI